MGHVGEKGLSLFGEDWESFQSLSFYFKVGKQPFPTGDKGVSKGRDMDREGVREPQLSILTPCI